MKLPEHLSNYLVCMPIYKQGGTRTNLTHRHREHVIRIPNDNFGAQIAFKARKQFQVPVINQ